jgi:CRP/FNR family transcriptional regulator, cyclic AMP receptor protein
VFLNSQKTLELPAGGVVFEKGDQGEEMYGVIEGSIELHNEERSIAAIGPDEIFGEMAIVDSSPRMATAVATEDTKLAVIDRHRFLFLVQETPMFALQVMSTMAERSRRQG